MTRSRGDHIEWQTWPESRRQRVTEWYDDLVALQSLIEFRLGIRHGFNLFRPSAFSVMPLNAWNPEGPWIPPGRLDLAGEYLEARLRGITGSAKRDLRAGISVSTNDATAEERELALDIRSMLAASARRLMSPTSSGAWPEPRFWPDGSVTDRLVHGGSTRRGAADRMSPCRRPAV